MWHGPTLNGGVAPTTGAVKSIMPPMVSSLVRLDGREDGLFVVHAGSAFQSVDRHLEDDEVQQRLGPLALLLRLRELVRELLAGLAQ